MALPGIKIEGGITIEIRNPQDSEIIVFDLV